MSGVAFASPFEPDLTPMRAMVVPRVRRAGGTASLAIDELVRALLSRPMARGLIVVTAPPGGGKTTALRHVRAMVPAGAPVDVFEAGRVSEALISGFTRLAFLAAEVAEPQWHALDVWEITSWTGDDHVEYLAAAHRQACPGVLARLRADGSLAALGGSPQLLTLVMDRMAGDPQLPDAHAALQRLAPVFFPHGTATGQLVADAIAAPSAMASGAGSATLRADQHRWWRHEAVRRVVAGDWIAAELSAGRRPKFLDGMGGRGVLPQIARAVRQRPAAIETLEQSVRDDPRGLGVPMAVSILLAVDREWRPPVGVARLYLRGANLRAARWSGVDLTHAALMNADFTGADLSAANLADATAAEATMTGACLHGALLGGTTFPEANLAGADLSEARGDRVSFEAADLSGANVASAMLTRAQLTQANLAGACLRGANLSHASLGGARVDDADFSGAKFDSATLDGLVMQAADWSGTSFRGAKLRKAVLEWVELPEADFSGADLSGAMLTGSHVPGGRFAGAVLREAGLAEIDWSGADLKSADLSAASFHLGSTRSGLVGSAVPGEGSRTGFYTDEFNEREYKSPEEIRKACLYGADLRGAVIEGTDFYLVDVREARYTAAQREVLRRCGAILE